MDKVINMSYCTKHGFQLLARNYLKIEIENSDSHKLYREIEDIIESKKVTPAEVAEKLMTKEIEKVDDNLQALFEFLESKKDESNEIKVEGINQTEDQKPKEVEIDEGEELIETSAKEL
ncbi:probable mitochondrial chaperone BCS1-A [Fagus crenata]